MATTVAPIQAPPLAVVRSRGMGATLVRSPRALFGITIFVLIVIAAIFAPVLAPHDPDQQDLVNRLAKPSFMDPQSPYLLGSDSLGRDLFSRMLYGSRVSLIVSVSAVVFGGTLGVVLGLLAGWYGGKVDAAIMRLVDVQMSIPYLVLAITIVAVFGASLRNLIIVLALTGWEVYARVVRSQVSAQRQMPFVDAARATGLGHPRIVLRHVLPNVLPSVVVIATLEVARVILAESGLSFLGLGIPPPAASWGGMIAEGREYLATAWWLVAFPSLAIVLTVLGINLFGDWLRDYLNPRLRA